MENLKFSIVIPSYNQGQFIEDTLLSILNQDYHNYEIIVIDGGSSDSTVSVLEKYSHRISYWHSKKDSGQSDAIVTGFLRATGDIFCWLNSDDVYLPGALKAVNNAFVSSRAEVVYGNKQLIDRDGNIVGSRLLTSFLPNLIRDAYLCGGFGIYQPASFWSRDLYHRSGGVDRSFRFCMDNDLFNKFVIVGARFCFLDRYLAGFRVHADSKTSTQQSIAESERAKLYRSYVIERGIKFPALKRFCARGYRGYRLLITGRLAKVILMRFFDKLKWVP